MDKGDYQAQANHSAKKLRDPGRGELGLLRVAHEWKVRPSEIEQYWTLKEYTYAIAYCRYMDEVWAKRMGAKVDESDEE